MLESRHLHRFRQLKERHAFMGQLVKAFGAHHNNAARDAAFLTAERIFSDADTEWRAYKQEAGN